MVTIFEAVADPTRRSILERLRAQGPLSLGELAEPFKMTRQAVTKHVDTLQESGLVRVERAGRRRLHELEPEPLREIDDWLAPYAAAWDRRLDRLRAHLEADEQEDP